MEDNVVFLKILIQDHFCMPNPLAPDPIRVQSYVWCLFYSILNQQKLHCGNILSFYLSHYPIRDKSLYRRYTVNGNVYFY